MKAEEHTRCATQNFWTRATPRMSSTTQRKGSESLNSSVSNASASTSFLVWQISSSLVLVCCNSLGRGMAHELRTCSKAKRPRRQNMFCWGLREVRSATKVVPFLRTFGPFRSDSFALLSLCARAPRLLASRVVPRATPVPHNSSCEDPRGIDRLPTRRHL